MSPTTESDRKSKPLKEKIPSDTEELARREARNALRQFDAVLEIIDGALASKKRFRLRPSAILLLNRVATDGTNEYAGVYRPMHIEISGSAHTPPPAEEVPALVEEMCEYVNDAWDRSPIHLSAYTMWRVNWIHPFVDGNGRTARALSYAILSIRLGYRLPGSKTIPEQISDDKFPYYDALETADAACKEDRLDVTALERFLGDKLAAQLLQLHKDATGGS